MATSLILVLPFFFHKSLTKRNLTLITIGGAFNGIMGIHRCTAKNPDDPWPMTISLHKVFFFLYVDQGTFKKTAEGSKAKWKIKK